MAQKRNYNLPTGYSLLQTALKSYEFLNNPIKFISKSMDAFSGTYSVSLGIKRKLILTQNPDFINYVLKENHRNYNKSELSTEHAVEFFGNGLSKYEDTGESMTNEQIVDKVLILIFAGHETTANTLSWVLYLLSINKEVLQKLTDSFDGSTIQECLINEYLKATINEAMRLYPAAVPEMKPLITLRPDKVLLEVERNK